MSTATRSFDAIIVGAGFAGMYMLYRLRALGLRTRVIEAGSDVGGTWYWNRYPGARCDVPSMEYSFSFSEDLEQEWQWSELMAGQPELLAYARHVADRFALRGDIEFETRVVAAHHDESTGGWQIETDRGDRYSAGYCIMATGCLSVPMSPEFPGASSFAGEVVHTGRWPKAGVPLDGRTVGIIGTGSSGVQAIPEIAKRAAHLFVFQRTPTYTFPANNRPLKDEYQQAFKASYAKVRKMQRASPAGFSGFRPSRGDPEDISAIPAGTAKHRQPNLLEAPIDEVRRTIEERGAGMLQNYRDVYIDPEANELACDLYREDVDRLVDDPLVAEALKPVGYPLGCKRQVLDTDYYAAFNRDNVTLVDLRPDRIVEITPDGLRTRKSHYTFDLLIYATGFDAMTGALTQIDITGKNGRSLRREWEHGPRSYLGLMSEGFPNLFTITGPGSPSVLSNVLVSIEQHVDWITDCLVYLRERGMGSIEPQRAAEDAWLAHVNEVAQNTMYTAPTCNSWYLGTNVPGKQRVFMPYVAGVGRYRKACEEIVANGYEGFTLTF